MKTYTVKILEIDNEELSEEGINYEFQMADDANEFHIYNRAVVCLWENRWTPGSIAWQVTNSKGNIIGGENF